MLCQFAEDVFAKADAEDRAGKASKATAKTFYAASIFFDALSQFGERGEEVEEKVPLRQIQGRGHHQVPEGGRPARAGASWGVVSRPHQQHRTSRTLRRCRHRWRRPRMTSSRRPANRRRRRRPHSNHHLHLRRRLDGSGRRRRRRRSTTVEGSPPNSRPADAVECRRFAIAACDARDAGLALEPPEAGLLCAGPVLISWSVSLRAVQAEEEAPQPDGRRLEQKALSGRPPPRSPPSSSCCTRRARACSPRGP